MDRTIKCYTGRPQPKELDEKGLNKYKEKFIEVARQMSLEYGDFVQVKIDEVYWDDPYGEKLPLRMDCEIIY